MRLPTRKQAQPMLKFSESIATGVENSDPFVQTIRKIGVRFVLSP
jgi:hypothetical protein